VHTQLEEMKVLFEQFVTEVTKFQEKQNKSAGLRARKLSTKLDAMFLKFRKDSVAEEKKF